jgi:hypothetical protein
VRWPNEPTTPARGSGFVRPLAKTAREMGIDILLQRRMTKIHREGPVPGRVTGITAIEVDDQYRKKTDTLNIRARKGIIIATGGSAGNPIFRTMFDVRLAQRIVNPYQWRPMPGASLRKTVERYNSFVDAGADADFKKPAPLHRIATPPFYAAWHTPALHDSHTGIRINTSAQVLDLRGEPIPALYACGDSSGGFGQHGICRAATFGRIAGFVHAKDVILAIIVKIGAAGATGHVIEYAGSAIRSLGIEGRLTICNMSIEAGARAGMVAPDDETFAYLQGRPYAPKGANWDMAVAYWGSLASDADAQFDREVSLNAAGIAPMVTWGTSPEAAAPITERVPDPANAADAARRDGMERALVYMDLKPGMPLAGIAIDRHRRRRRASTQSSSAPVSSGGRPGVRSASG